MGKAAPVSATLLNAVTATGASNPLIFQTARSRHTLQVVLGGAVAATAAVVTLKGTLDGVTFNTIATWSLAGGQVSGDLISVDHVNVIGVEASLDTFTGGTTPNCTANYSGTD